VLVVKLSVTDNLTAKTKDYMIRKQLEPEKHWPKYLVRDFKTEGNCCHAVGLEIETTTFK
jgi:hypothetical protein